MITITFYSFSKLWNQGVEKLNRRMIKNISGIYIFSRHSISRVINGEWGRRESASGLTRRRSKVCSWWWRLMGYPLSQRTNWTERMERTNERTNLPHLSRVTDTDSAKTQTRQTQGVNNLTRYLVTLDGPPPWLPFFHHSHPCTFRHWYRRRVEKKNKSFFNSTLK